MSIITDTLNRLQSDHAQIPAGQSSGLSSQETPSITGFAQRAKHGASWRLPVLGWLVGGGVVLFGLGFGAYLWGLFLIPESSSPLADRPARVSPLVSPPESIPDPSLERSRLGLGAEAAGNHLPVDDTTGVGESLAETHPPNLIHQAGGKAGKPVSPSVESAGVGSSFQPATPAMVETDQPDNSVGDAPVNVVSATTSKADDRAVDISGKVETIPAQAPGIPSVSAVPSGQRQNLQASLSTAAILIETRHLIRQDRYQEALEVLQSVEKKVSRNWKFWMLLGTIRLGLGEFDLAEQAFLEGLAHDSTVAHLWIQRAIVAQQQGRYDQAVSALRQAEILDPDFPEVSLNLAYTFELQGLFDSALRYYRRFLTLTEGQTRYVAVRKKILNRVVHLFS